MSKQPTRMKDIAEATRDSFIIDPTRIVVEKGFNTRDFSMAENQAHLDWMIESIRSQGVLEPITVRYDAGTCILVNGETRLRACLKLLEQGVKVLLPAMTEAKGINEVDRTANLIARNGGKQLSALEQGAVFKRLIGYHLTEKTIAAKTGVSEDQIRNVLLLMAASPAVQDFVREGRVSATEAIRTIKDKGQKKATGLLEKAVQHAADEGKPRATGTHVRKAAGETRITKTAAEQMRTALEQIAGGAANPRGIAEAALISIKDRDKQAA